MFRHSKNVEEDRFLAALAELVRFGRGMQSLVRTGLDEVVMTYDGEVYTKATFFLGRHDPNEEPPMEGG